MTDRRSRTFVFVAAACFTSFGVSGAMAAHRHHRAPGASVRHATANANAHGGTAKEVAPDSKQSATGGQPGGLPGTQ